MSNQRGYEYRDFVMQITKSRRDGWLRVSKDGGYTLGSARLAFWQEIQNTVLPELQKWIDQGWEPISEVGPASITLDEYTRFTATGFTAWLLMIAGFFTFFITWIPLLIGGWSRVVRPVELKVAMRRAK